MKNFEMHVEKKLDVSKMINASTKLVGTHDFKAFTAKKNTKNLPSVPFMKLKWNPLVRNWYLLFTEMVFCIIW